jgi:hypothetical protein
MQKLSTYLYPNRIELLADLIGFSVEYTNVYQRTIKIYNGIDNTIEFDIKNADQKRIDLTTLSILELNIMDASGAGLPNSPYAITPAAIKGIASVIIPQEDLTTLDPQFLKYSVSAVKAGNDVMLYCDSQFGAVGTMELVGDAMPIFRDEKIYDSVTGGFTGEIDFSGNVITHSCAIPAVFYEAVPTATMSFAIAMVDFKGSIWLEGTEHSTISLSSFQNVSKLVSYQALVSTTTIITFNDVNVGKFKYFRVSWQNSTYHGINGKVDTITVS